MKTAIYFDYEGRAGHPPVLLGTLTADGYYGAIIGRQYEDFADHTGVRPSGKENHRKFALDLISRAHDEGRLLVSWSEHDLRLISEAIAGEKGANNFLRESYVNAAAIARRWGRHLRPPLQRPHKLARYADACHFAVPARFGEGTVGSNLRRLDAALEKHTRYAELTPGQRQAWRTVVKHNKYDLRSTRHVLRVVTSG